MQKQHVGTVVEDKREQLLHCMCSKLKPARQPCKHSSSCSAQHMVDAWTHRWLTSRLTETACTAIRQQISRHLVAGYGCVYSRSEQAPSCTKPLVSPAVCAVRWLLCCISGGMCSPVCVMFYRVTVVAACPYTVRPFIICGRCVESRAVRQLQLLACQPLRTSWLCWRERWWGQVGKQQVTS